MTDDLPARIIRAYTTAKDADWRVAQLTAEFYGDYDPEKTKAVARACNVSTDTVGRWAQAWWAWEFLDGKGSANCGSDLGLSFYYRAYKFIEEAGRAPLMELLQQARDEGRSAGWLGAQLSELYDDPKGKDYPSRVNKLVKLLEREAIVTDYFGLESKDELEIADDIRESCKSVIENIQRLNAKIAERETA